MLWLPRVKRTVRPATGWPRSSTSEAVRVMFLLGFDLLGPVYVAVVVLWFTVTWVGDVSQALSGSQAVNSAVNVPGPAYTWLTLAPPEALGEPSPKSQLYVRNGCSSVPGSTALPLSVIGMPHSVDMLGPALATGGRLPMFTLKAVESLLPSASVAVSRPL